MSHVASRLILAKLRCMDDQDVACELHHAACSIVSINLRPLETCLNMKPPAMLLTYNHCIAHCIRPPALADEPALQLPHGNA